MNQITNYDDTLLVTMTNTFTASFFTASSSDYDRIAHHHWRLINDCVVTTTFVEGYERRTTLDSVLTGGERKLMLYHRDTNPLNYLRSNLTFTPRGRLNDIIPQNTHEAIVVLPNAQVAVVDRIDVPRITPFYWRFATCNGSGFIKSIVGRSVMRLPRVIMNLPTTSPNVVTYANGDCFDNRRQNLQVRTSHNGYIR